MMPVRPRPSSPWLAGLPLLVPAAMAFIPAVSTDWSAQLAGRDGRKVAGTATAKPTADGKGMDVQVTLAGDTPGATRPWHIHTGSCTASGGVVGGGRVYPPMIIDAKGNGAAKATLPVALADTATFYVNIHDAAAAMGIIVACGDLVKR
jgi:hypothetical protein